MAESAVAAAPRVVRKPLKLPIRVSTEDLSRLRTDPPYRPLLPGPARRPARRRVGRLGPRLQHAAPRPRSFTAPPKVAQPRRSRATEIHSGPGASSTRTRHSPATCRRRQVPVNPLRTAAASLRAALPHAVSAERVDPPPSRAPSARWTASIQRGRRTRIRRREVRWSGQTGWKWSRKKERRKGRGKERRVERWKGEEELMRKGEKKEGSRKEEREKVEG